MNRLIAALAFAFTLLGLPVVAQNNPVVVEFYTSQGCPSCKGVHAMLEELAPREDVIALALHVDYWDYIGWEDPYGDPAHSERQRAYAAHANRSSVYTPEMVVNGSTDIIGAKSMKLAQAIAEHAAAPQTVALSIQRKGPDLIIQAENLAGLKDAMTIHMLRYIPTMTTEVKRGENKGRTITQRNIVEGWTVLGEWDGQAPLKISKEISGDKPIVVILQQQITGPIVAAARIR